MLDNDPQKELNKLKDCEDRTESLRERWDLHWSLYRLDDDVYGIPAEKGEWEQVYSNRAPAEGNKIIDYLSYARRKLYIPVTDEKSKSRASLVMTEQLANGSLALADSLIMDDPESVDTQSSLSFFRVIRGWSAIRLYIRDEEGKLIPDIAVWDPYNVRWLYGKHRLLKVYYIRYATVDEVKDEYKGWNGTADEPGDLVKIIDAWDCSELGKKSQEGIIIGKDYVKDPEDTILDYIPVRIKAGRSTPLIADSKHTDNLKFVGNSYLANNETLFVPESKLLSYTLTRASQLAKTPRIIQFDSSIAPLPPRFEKDPYVAGRTIALDKAKGQELKEALTPPSGAEIDKGYAVLVGLAGIGGLSPVAYGQINQALPAQGIDILSHATMDIIKPFKKAIEDDFKWMANEIARQYKNGDFGEYELEGYDKSDNPFRIKVKPKQIDDKWKFQCELIPDLLRDRSANANLASQMVRDGLMSRKTARDEFQIVVDTDLEEEKIAQEQSKSVFNIGELEALFAYIKDYAQDKDPYKLFVINHALKQLGRSMQPQPEQQQTYPARQNNAGGGRPIVPRPIQEAAAGMGEMQ